MKSHHTIFRHAVLLVLFLPLSASATLLLYDGFDYTAGSLVGQNEGTGFKTAWANSGTAAASSVISNGAEYTDSTGIQLLSHGGKVSVSATDTSGVFRTFDPITAASGGTTTYWVSFLGNTSGMWTQTGGSYSAALVLRNGNTELLAVGAFGTTDAWRVRANGTTYSSATGIASSSSEAFIVMRIDIDTTTGGADSVYLWVDPALATTPSIAASTVSITGTNLWDSFSLSLLRIGTMDGGAHTSKAITLDELRVGTDFANVAPIPEPAAQAIMSGSLILMIAALRRRDRR